MANREVIQVNKLMILIVAIFVFATASTVMAGDDKDTTKSYYQFSPNQTLQPATIWNPIITEKKDGTVYKSFYQFTPNPVQPAGSIWNPLITTDERKKK
jgi:hypothetical protein